MAKILAIGNATIDWVQLVDSYPVIDSEVRANAQHIWRGGNATNTLVVLSQLGHTCSWLGTIADDVFAQLIREDLEQYTIDFSHCRCITASVSPSSHILLNLATGERTIVHYRDLPELCASDVIGFDFSTYDWLHVEGRNVAETLKILQQVRGQSANIKISLELEKPRKDIECLFDYVDILLCGKHYAQSQGYNSAETFLRAMQTQLPDKHELVCAWGDQGAYVITDENTCMHVPAISQTRLIDSRAAGDVFNAAYIDARIQGCSRAESTESACRLAGRKCSQLGLDGLD